MSRPVLVAVDEDAEALQDIERELRERYARHYRVVCMRSADEALACLEELAAAGERGRLDPCRAVALRDDRQRAVGRGASPSSAGEARAADRVG